MTMIRNPWEAPLERKPSVKKPISITFSFKEESVLLTQPMTTHITERDCEYGHELQEIFNHMKHEYHLFDRKDGNYTNSVTIHLKGMIGKENYDVSFFSFTTFQEFINKINKTSIHERRVAFQ